MTWGIIINSKNIYLLDFVMQPQFADTIFLQASGSLGYESRKRKLGNNIM